MIRDQFQNVKKVTTKEARKKASMGERNYYSKRVNKLQDLKKSLGISMIITTSMLAVAYAVVLLAFIISFNTEHAYELWKFIIWSVVFGASLIFTIVWYVALKPSVSRKIDYYRHELEIINAKTLSKAAATYTLYGDAYKKQQEKAHREDKEKIEQIAKEKTLNEQAEEQINAEKTSDETAKED